MGVICLSFSGFGQRFQPSDGSGHADVDHRIEVAARMVGPSMPGVQVPGRVDRMR